jgi:pyruvate dehydrogenase E1 component
MNGRKGPAVAATDYIRNYADQLRPYMDRHYIVLGTDGFGRSDMRVRLREFFEVNRYYVALATLKALADTGEIEPGMVTEAIKKYGLNPNKPNPVTV